MSGPSQTTAKPLQSGLLGWISLFLGLRLLVLLTSVEKIFWYEELYSGVIAKGMLDGIRIPLLDWLPGPYSGGSLVVGLTALPFFKLFGANLFALKMVPLLLSLTTLVLMVCFLNRFFGPWAANAAALLMIFSTPNFTRLSFLAIGAHEDLLFLTMAAFFCFYEFMEKGRKKIFLFLCGFFGGLGTGLVYIAGIGVLSLVAGWFFRDRKSFLSRDLGVFLLGLGIGFSPCLLYNATHAFRGFHFLVQSFYPAAEKTAVIWSGGWDFCTRVLWLAVKCLPFSFCFESFQGIPGAFLNYAYFCPVLFLYLVLWRKLSLKALPFCVYPLFFLLIYAFSQNRFPIRHFYDNRYFSPLQWMILIIAAISLSTFSSNIRKIVLSVLIALGLAGQSSLLFQGKPGLALQVEGYSYYQLGSRWEEPLFPFPWNYFRFREAIQKLPEGNNRRLLYLGWMQHGADCDLIQRGLSPELLAGIKTEPSLTRAYFWEAVAETQACHGPEAFQQGIRLAENLSDGEKEFFYHGLFGPMIWAWDMPEAEIQKEKDKIGPGLKWAYWSFGQVPEGPQNFSARIEKANALPAPEKKWAYQGMGATAGINFYSEWVSFGREDHPVLPQEIPTENTEDYGWGFGWGAAQQSLLRWYLYPLQNYPELKKVPAAYLNAVLKGFQACLEWYGVK